MTKARRTDPEYARAVALEEFGKRYRPAEHGEFKDRPPGPPSERAMKRRARRLRLEDLMRGQSPAAAPAPAANDNDDLDWNPEPQPVYDGEALVGSLIEQPDGTARALDAAGDLIRVCRDQAEARDVVIRVAGLPVEGDPE